MIKIIGKGPKGGEVAASLKGELEVNLSERKERIKISDEGVMIVTEEGEKDIVIKIDDFKRIASSNTIIFDSSTILDIVKKEGMQVPSLEEVTKIVNDRDIVDAAHVCISIMVMEKLAEVVNKDAAE